MLEYGRFLVPGMVAGRTGERKNACYLPSHVGQ
jgi:hypothetical protein